MRSSDHDNARADRARRILYVAVGFHLAIGLVLFVVAGVAADYVAAFLGVVIVSGTLAAAAIAQWLLEVAARVSDISTAIATLKTRIDAIKLPGDIGAGANDPKKKQSPVRTLDLSALGDGDPSRLTAATLDRDVFPRLVRTMEAAPPARSGEAQDDAPHEVEAGRSTAGLPCGGIGDDVGGALTDGPPAGPAAKNLWRQWKVALRNEDLATCRALSSALVETSGPRRRAQLRAEMETLADRMERRLRLAFSDRVNQNDFAGALAVGERIIVLLPDRAVAADFERLRPYLQRRRDVQSGGQSGTRAHARG
jgi:hypothetical protein